MTVLRNLDFIYLSILERETETERVRVVRGVEGEEEDPKRTPR